MLMKHLARSLRALGCEVRASGARTQRARSPAPRGSPTPRVPPPTGTIAAHRAWPRRPSSSTTPTSLAPSVRSPRRGPAAPRPSDASGRWPTPTTARRKRTRSRCTDVRAEAWATARRGVLCLRPGPSLRADRAVLRKREETRRDYGIQRYRHMAVSQEGEVSCTRVGASTRHVHFQDTNGLRGCVALRTGRVRQQSYLADISDARIVAPCRFRSSSSCRRRMR